MLSSQHIRAQFLKFFEDKGHHVVSSSSLVPHEDPTLLFTNAGMNQFKDVFLGEEQRNYVRAASSQKCVRAGGKHNDLENVGYTARHHTFFEMLGNFSFGDYFKKEAIHFAWELLTEVYAIPKEKLLVTVYADDNEAYGIWEKDIGIPTEKIIKIGDNKGSQYASDNFWMMGDTGPCGPCSEIFYDHGDTIEGGVPGSHNEDGDRFIEIWNLVFMQFNRDDKGVMHPLPKPSVDTGMGLERITAILQDVHSNYDIDIFKELIAEAAKLTKTNNTEHPSLKVLSDHIRATTFLIGDGVLPANEGRGYVLRRIIRRAIRHGYKLGARAPFFFKLVAPLNLVMGDTYVFSKEQSRLIESEIHLEEKRFFETIENGMGILEDTIKELVGKNKTAISGKVAFKLHDTFGFPLDLTADVCRENGISINSEEFDAEMDKQKTMAREAGNFKAKLQINYSGPDTVFLGYDKSSTSAILLGIVTHEQSVASITNGESAMLILDQTPFYAESGGQIGDIGSISSNKGVFDVTDTFKIKGNIYVHVGSMIKGKLSINDKIEADINHEHRQHVMRNHSATHLMHKALKEILGNHIEQKGSLVDSYRTRFDFSHPKPLTSEEKTSIELMVNQEILKNQTTQASVMDIDSAKKTGAMMLFGEKYGDEVRVLEIGNSKELCGGTHVAKTGDIGLFKIQSESGISSGIRRVEATTGLNVIGLIAAQETIIDNVTKELNVGASEVTSKVSQLMKQLKDNEKIISQLKSKIAGSEGSDLVGQAIDTGKYQFLGVSVDRVEANELREMIDNLKEKFQSAVIILGSHSNNKVSFAVGVTDNLTQEIKAGDIAKLLGEAVGGKGGGRDNMAMAGGPNIQLIDEAISQIKDHLIK
ncbi:alanine--tRNA ligase [Methylophilaceae bacterium]|jgi:alanyl-tRNA synthetase|nr:alanine--tRNA ligase [Betaproteobacteria bacterium]MCH9841885.1 alanine--tRNA ligase [Betaproteobacteria bacterium]MDA9087836.1 alanine--tRNA ligase [Methylophilaceae bacterium]MDC0115590.1 alanine--tRNA ligase [Methylophilaceae bacterium]MDC0877221.1 alanine--tRNA ligase [Methylophilaceae bacterium]